MIDEARDEGGFPPDFDAIELLGDALSSVQESLEFIVTKAHKDAFRRGFIVGYFAGAKMISDFASDPQWVFEMLAGDLENRNMKALEGEETIPEAPNLPRIPATHAILGALLAKMPRMEDAGSDENKLRWFDAFNRLVSMLPPQPEPKPGEPTDAAPNPPAAPTGRPEAEAVAAPLVGEVAPAAEISSAVEPQWGAPLPSPVNEKPPAVEKSSDPQPATPAALIVARSAGPTWRTPERQAVMVKLYPTAETMAEVDNAINALDGGKVKRSWLYTWANELKLRRPPPPAGGYPQKKKSVPTPPNGKGPVSADFEQIEQWSAIRGIDFARAGIEAVNKKRTDLGLPPFALRGRGVGA